MLKHLTVKDFVLIDECSLDFESGFSAFTGETGAGKSLLIDAMCLLAGERASSSFIKQNAAKAIVEGVFDITKNEAVESLLNENGFNVENHQVTLRREINRDGKSTVLINGKQATLNLLKECVQHEIDIHSQHDTQYLLNKNSQLHLVDQMIADSALKDKVAMLYHQMAALKKEYETAINSTYNENDLEFIQMEIDEIEKANLIPQQEEELEKRQKEIQLFEKTFTRLNDTVALLEESDGANEKLYAAVHQLSDLESDVLKALYQRLNEHYNEIVDVTEELKDTIAAMDVSEEEINAIQSRLYEIQRLKRKYGPSVEAILNRKAEMEQQVELILHRQSYIEQMEAQIEAAHRQFVQAAKQLSELRHQKATLLQQQIEQHCQDLMLPYARFIVDFQTIEGNRYGIDDLEFYISMNPGEMPRPLARVASGGELSRLMLGLKTIFTKLQGIQTVIFDEIDTGVSGAVATAIGLKMATLARDAQVFSVTHLAQVAACAKNHYLVRKTSTSDSTATEVLCLTEEERLQQLALISSGAVTEASLKAALELFKSTQGKVGEGCNG